MAVRLMQNEGEGYLMWNTNSRHLLRIKRFNCVAGTQFYSNAVSP